MHCIDHTANTSLRLPHSEITKGFVRDVLETKDLLNIRLSDYVAKASWASGPRDSKALSGANDAAKKAFDILPYIGMHQHRDAVKKSKVEANRAIGRPTNGRELAEYYNAYKKRQRELAEQAKKKAQEAKETEKADK